MRSPSRHRDGDVDGGSRDDGHLPAHEAKTHYRDEDGLLAGRHVDDFEAPVDIRERLLARGLNFDKNSNERSAGARFKDNAGHTAGRGLGEGVWDKKQQDGDERRN